MTEAEWLTAQETAPLWEHVKDHPRWTPRTLRLFVAAFWGWQSKRLRGKARADLRRRAEAFEQWAETGELAHPHQPSNNSGLIFFNMSPVTAVATTVTAPGPHWTTGWETCVQTMPTFFRDIFGNPFRPVAVDPSWLTSTVVALARGIYEDRAFDRMPILADALQDAGCENPDVLNHCRDPQQVHVRGCFAIDLLLDKM